MTTTRKHLPALVGVIHLPALAGTPGAPDASSALARAGFLAVNEARALAQAGFDGLILENFGDTPFYKSQVPPETIATLAVIAAAVREAVRIPVGINVLRNDARAALAIAAVTGCDFIRVNVLSGVAATDQGMIEGDAAFLLRERERLGAVGIAILGDVHVKHARSLSSDDIQLGVEEVALRSSADGVIITGSTTGRPVDLEQLRIASEMARSHGIPLYVGSGATLKNLAELKRFAAGVIVGSALRKGGQAGAPLDPKAIKAFAQAFRRKGEVAQRKAAGAKAPQYPQQKKKSKKKKRRP
jgi:membrane complex biogenesis BtpA family protein